MQLKLEREIYDAWVRRFLPWSEDAYTRKAKRSFAASTFSAASEGDVLRKIQSFSSVCIGDDFLLSEDREYWIKLLSEANTTFEDLITDRMDKQVLDWAKKQKVRVLKLRNSQNLKSQDRQIARKLKSLSGRKALVWTGSLRLAPSHLPRTASAIGVNPLFLSLEAPWIRWKMKKKAEWARIRPNLFVWIGRSPLWGIAKVRAIQGGDSAFFSPEQLLQFFREHCKKISNQLSGKKISPPRRILHPFSFYFFTSGVQRALGSTTRQYLMVRLKRGESVVIPEKKLVLLSSLSPGEVAEEVAHYVRLSDRKKVFGDFYFVAVEEAFAFMVSRLIDPRRKFETRSNEVDRWASVHRIGYGAGNRLAQAWESSPKARRKIRKLWRVEPNAWNETIELWNEIQKIS